MVHSQGIPDRVFWLGVLLTAATLIGGFGAQLYRYRHFSDAVQRQQTRWILLGFTGPLFTFLLWLATFNFFSTSQPTVARVYFIAAVTPFLVVGILVFPLAIAFSVLRYRLWEIDVVINRTLVSHRWSCRMEVCAEVPADKENIGPEVKRLVRKINTILEQAILDNPEQYLWIHDRYRTQPDGEETELEEFDAVQAGPETV